MLTVALIGYPLSIGPACWLTANHPGDRASRPKWLVIYLPFGMWLQQGRECKLLRWWMELGTKRGDNVMVPYNAAATNWRGFEKQ